MPAVTRATTVPADNPGKSHCVYGNEEPLQTRPSCYSRYISRAAPIDHNRIPVNRPGGVKMQEYRGTRSQNPWHETDRRQPLSYPEWPSVYRTACS